MSSAVARFNDGELVTVEEFEEALEKDLAYNDYLYEIMRESGGNHEARKSKEVSG